MLKKFETLNKKEKEMLVAQKREQIRELNVKLSLCTSDAQEERIGDLIDGLYEDIALLEK